MCTPECCGTLPPRGAASGRGPKGGRTVWLAVVGSRVPPCRSPSVRCSCPPRAAPPARPRVRRSRGADMRLCVHACVSLVLCRCGVASLSSPAAFPRLGTTGDPLPLFGAWGIRVWRESLTTLSGVAFGERRVGRARRVAGRVSWRTPARGSSAVAAASVVARVASSRGPGGGPSFSGRLGLRRLGWELPQESWGGVIPAGFASRLAWSSLGAVVSSLVPGGGRLPGMFPSPLPSLALVLAVSFPLPVCRRFSPVGRPGRAAGPPPLGGGDGRARTRPGGRCGPGAARPAGEQLEVVAPPPAGSRGRCSVFFGGLCAREGCERCRSLRWKEALF